MKRTKRFPMVNGQLEVPRQERGVSLIIVILVLAFLQIVGLMLLMVTRTGSRVAGNMRTQQMAYNAAEAGFDVGWTEIEEFFADGEWTSFDGHYLTEPSGIDDPQSDNYFRRLTDLEVLDLIDPDGDGTPDVSTVIFFREPYIDKGGSPDPRYTYTVFLIDDEAGGSTPDPGDALLVCIGCVGIDTNMTTSRLEIELVIQVPGT